MKAIVHIGAPKTGSSSIQDFLFVNRDALAARGFRFERNVRNRGSQWEYPLAAHHALGKLLEGKDERLRYSGTSMENMGQEVAKPLEALKRFSTRFSEPTAVFSTEHALPWLKTSETIEAFDLLFSEAFESVRYVLYLRDPIKLIPSSYSERLKRGVALDFSTFLTKRLRGLKFADQIELWDGVVGRDRLDVRLMDRGTLFQGDLLDDFCAAIGTTMDGLSRPAPSNTALSGVGIVCLEALNPLMPEILPEGGYNPLRKTLLQRVVQLTADERPFCLKPWQQKKIQNETRDQLERIRRDRFPERETLFPVVPEPKPMPDIVIERKARAAMAVIIRDLRQELVAQTASRPADRLARQNTTTPANWVRRLRGAGSSLLRGERFQ